MMMQSLVDQRPGAQDALWIRTSQDPGSEEDMHQGNKN